MQLLSRGLDQVPLLEVDSEIVLTEIEAEVISVSRAIFRSHLGFSPFTVSGSVQEHILSIIAQAPAGSKAINEIITLYENFKNSVHDFLSTPSSGLSYSKLVGSLPPGSIITKSDKNVGISVLPLEWYIREYEVQIAKGGYVKVDMSEPQCLA